MLVGTYPPTACGLATFTSNLRRALLAAMPGWQAHVVRVLDAPEPEQSREVVAQWVAGDPSSLATARVALAPSEAVLLQHEYGAFPGRDGELVLRLLEGLRAPLVSVLHTVLERPTPHQRDVLGRLVEALASGRPVVATRFPHAEELLASGAGVLVEHGDVDASSAALERVLYEPGVAGQMAAAARLAAQPLLCSAVGRRYRDLILQLTRTRVVA